MNKLRIALVGAAGKMGRAISALAEMENAEVVGAFDVDDQIRADEADVLIDFSTAAATEATCAEAEKTRKPLVMGTTGHSMEQRRTIEAAGASIPIVLTPNFSVGVNVLFALAEKAAAIVGQRFDCEIVEMHHRMKKDAPSGTAKTLSEILRHAGKAGRVRYGREGITGERDKSEIGIHAVRGGDVVGDHIVIFAGDGERLELTHRASSRETFARGALQAAHWVMGKAPGLYSMRDVLGL